MLGNRNAQLNPYEAPEGYRAVLKTSLSYKERSENFCRACDWRSECQKITDTIEHYQRCSSIGVILADGREVCRHDRCSVVFKRK